MIPQPGQRWKSVVTIDYLVSYKNAVVQIISPSKMKNQILTQYITAPIKNKIREQEHFIVERFSSEEHPLFFVYLKNQDAPNSVL
jgi:hypothetical protein